MKTHRWADLKHRGKLSAERIAEIEAEARAEAFEMSLRELRESLGVSQERLAELTEMAQSAVSRMERRTDWRLSTLRKVVEALGGHLEVIAELPDHRRVRLA